MTGLQIFAFLILPVIVVAIGWAGVVLDGRARHGHRNHPAE